jgi:sugar/nucleoside kinase (ribokinase family)
LTTLDLIQLVDQPVAPDVKLEATASILVAGGPAANAAVTFAALGGQANLFSSLGAGPLATVAKADLGAQRVVVVDLSADAHGDELPLSSITVYAQTGERCVVSANGGDRYLGDKVASLPGGLDVVLVDGHYPEMSASTLEMLPNGVPIVMDAGSWKEAAVPLLGRAAAVICSADFQPPRVNSDDVTRYLLDLGVQFAAVSHGAGDLSWRSQESEGRITPVPRRVVDTLGAGDILHGAFVYYLCQRRSNGAAITLDMWVGSLALAADIAGMSCEYFGPREWVTALRTAHGQHEAGRQGR